MKPKTMILLVIAVGCGLAASVMTSRLIADRNTPVEAKVKVIATKVKLNQHTLIKDPEKVFYEKEVPESAVPKSALKSLEGLKDKKTSRTLSEDAMVCAEDLVSKESSGLSAELPPGMRAVAIKVNQESLAGGFVLPGSRVDVVCTFRRGDQDSVAQTILQSMLVLAVDTINNRTPDSGNSIIGTTVTLAAKPEETQRLSLAQSLGELRLVLRPVGETEKIAIRSAKIGDLSKAQDQNNGNATDEDPLTGASSGMAPLPMIPAPPMEQPKVVVDKKVEEDPLSKHTMTLITGDSVQRVVFVKDKQGWDTNAAARRDDEEQPRRAPLPLPTEPRKNNPTPPAPGAQK